MKRHHCVPFITVLTAVPGSAMASDYTGVATLFIMLPLLVISIAVAMLMHLARRRWPRFPARWPSLLLFAPILALALFVFFFDTVSLIPKIRPRDPNSFALLILVSYIGAVVVLIRLGWSLVRGSTSQTPQGSAGTNTDAPSTKQAS